MKYTPSSLTWGCELEFGDIPRWIEIPKDLGQWEQFETDIVNQREPYWGIAADPFGIDPPFGGEINTVPTKTWMEQIKKINQLIEYFTNLGYPPTISCVQQFHIHVRILNKFRKDIDALKNLISYIKHNQKSFIEITSQFKLDDRMSQSAIDFLRDDGGRIAEDSMYDEMLKCDSFKDMMEFDRTKTVNNIIERYGINLKSLVYNNTLEFRSFRATLNLKEYIYAFSSCENFVLSGLNVSSKPIEEKLVGYQFPRFEYDHELFYSWEKTKKSKNLTSVKKRFSMDLTTEKPNTDHYRV
jgi:hypothetical protein